MIDLQNVTVGCIGCGTMGGSLIKAFAKSCNKKNIFVSAAHFEKAKSFADEVGVNAVKSNEEVVQKAQYVFLAVKPVYVKSVIDEIKNSFNEKTVLISMAAGVTLKTLASYCNSNTLSAPTNSTEVPHLIRIMPNIPATVGEAMTALTPASDVLENDIEVVKALLATAGKAEQVAEKLMDGVTAVSGSGPAYVFMFIEALADAAVKFGMPRKQAYIYASQTLLGSAKMAMEDGRSISELKDAVCSPSGTTIEGVVSLERHGFRSAVIEAATAAYNKSIDLGKR
ncbi:MAG: pyrroline-5-carboxylate reductase [Treponema sp.]